MGFFTKQWWVCVGTPLTPPHTAHLSRKLTAVGCEEVEVTTKNHNTFREHRNPLRLVAREVSRQRD